VGIELGASANNLVPDSSLAERKEDAVESAMFEDLNPKKLHEEHLARPKSFMDYRY
jgi:hypothetical protein